MVVGDDDRDSSDRDMQNQNDAGGDGGVDCGHSAV